MSPQADVPPHGHESDEPDAILLEQAVTKLLLYGRKVGVTPEEMVSLLDSGMSMSGLLAFLAAKSLGVA